MLADMAIQRMANLAIVVDDLDAAVTFFGELGMELECRGPVEGAWADRTVGLDGMRSEIAMSRIPDGHGKLELTRYHVPAAAGAGQSDRRPARWACTASCSLWTTSITPSPGCTPRDAELLGEAAQFERIFLLCYLRGPAGVIVALAGQIG